MIADHPAAIEKRQVQEDWRHYVPLLLHMSFAVPQVSILLHGDLPASFEATCWELVAHYSNNNSDFARLLELGLTHNDAAIEAALLQTCVQGSWSVDAVRQLLNFASTPQVPPPLDPAQYRGYQGTTATPDLSTYNRLLEVLSRSKRYAWKS